MKDVGIVKVLLAAIVCLSGSVAFADEKASHATPPAKRVLDHAQRDEGVKYTVEERLRMDGRIDWEILDVEVSQGHVTLYGEVETKEEKGFATDITSTVPGVVEITNRILVDTPLSKNHLLQKAVWDTLRGVDALQTDPLRVRAKDGVVPLSGMVKTAAQEAAAGKAAESVSGVKKVVNTIHVGGLPFQTEQDTLLKENRERLR